jgi:hypothetical protein
MNIEKLIEWDFTEETEVFRENLPRAPSSATNLTWPELELNPDNRCATFNCTDVTVVQIALRASNVITTHGFRLQWM